MLCKYDMYIITESKYTNDKSIIRRTCILYVLYVHSSRTCMYNAYVSTVKLSGSGSQLYVLQVNFLMSERSPDAPKLKKCYVYFAADCTICFDKVFISLT